jgi:LPS-assembly protein
VARLTSFEPKEQSVRAQWHRSLAFFVPRGPASYRQAVLKTVYLLITITVLAASHPHLMAQQVTTLAPPPAGTPDAPGAVRYPVAEVLPSTDDTTTVVTKEDTLTRVGSVLTLDGNVEVTYKDRVVRADHIEYDSDTGDLTATGHLRVTGGANHEDISASHGTMNLNTQTGRFYDVAGSVGVKQSPGHKTTVYVSSNPFLFSGRMVVKTGPQEYQIYDGTVTSCQLPHPDWLLSADLFSVDSEKASAKGSVFHLMNIPLLYFPYVTHPVDPQSRQSGVLIPVISNSSTKGIVLGEEFYWAINRSMDLTVGVDYLSARGWQQSASYRYRGLGDDFAIARYTGLQDRGIYINGVYENQGGEDVTFLGRHDFTDHTRVVATAEYLSSYAYRQAFTENFNDAVSSDILSIAYGTHEADGVDLSARVDRYQGLKQVATPVLPEEEVRIFHAPSLDFDTTEHEIGRSGVLWQLDSTAAGLSRVQPNFSSGGITERFDIHPELIYPMSFGNWHVRSSVGARDTLYSRSLKLSPVPGVPAPPVELPNGLNRADLELEVDIRPPVVERTFDSTGVEKFFGHDVRHTIEPEVTYRYVTGVDNFLNVPRFDETDIVSNTNELEYGVTQRLFMRPLKNAKPCTEKEMSESTRVELNQREWDPDRISEKRLPGCGNREWISWRLTQKLFFNENFGGAVVNGRRNIFTTTLNLSGVAFLTEPREISPLISRLRVRTSANMDIEWDFDLDTGAKKFTSNNVLIDVHQGDVFAGLSYARLNAPGRSYTEGVSSSVSNFSQLRLLLGYGSPTKQGLGVAAGAGLDLNYQPAVSGLVQYGAVQTSYNWNCCGFSVEYRKYDLGSVRDEGVWSYNFTLANIATAGKLKRSMSLF